MADYWRESKIFSGSVPPPGLELGRRRREDLRVQYETAQKQEDKEPTDRLEDISNRMAYAKANAAWKALVQAFGEEKAWAAKKFYDVEVMPREVTATEQRDKTRLEIEYDIVIKPKPYTGTEPSLNTATEAAWLCASCEVGEHKWHDYEMETIGQPCVCIECN